jgi:hypothetical protein
MKAECVLNHIELNEKRKLIQRNRIKRILNQPTLLTDADTDIISNMLSAYDNSFDQNFDPSKFQNSHLFFKDYFGNQINLEENRECKFF